MVDDREMKELEQLLLTRAIPEMRSNLAERIIAQAHTQHRPAQKKSSVSSFLKSLREFWDDILVPRPAMAFSLVLCLGAFIGFDGSLIATDTSVQDFISYLQIAERADLGDLS